MSYSSIGFIDWTFSNAITPGQSGPGSYSNERVLLIIWVLQHYLSLTIKLFNVTSGQSLGESYSSAEMQLVYSSALADWAALFHHHHYHVMPPARISLTLSRLSSLSSIASGRSSKLHPVSSQSCCMCVRAGRPAFVRPNEGVHRSTSLMSSSLLLQECPACLVRLTWIVFVMGGKWPYS